MRMKFVSVFKGFALVAAMMMTVVAAVAPSQAISRYTSTEMACASIHARIASEGAVILRWKQGNIQRYDRFVASSNYCDPGERAVLTTVPDFGLIDCPVQKCKRCERRGLGLFDTLWCR